MTIRWLAILTGAAMGLTACGARPSTEAISSPSAVPAVSAAASESPRPGEFGWYDTGNGRELWIQCIGNGGPPIILEAGGGSDSSDWPPEIRALADQTTLCLYDRAGFGHSADTAQPETMAGVVDDLAGLLAAARVPGPYLLVGGSLGGQIVLHYALTHEADTAGLVILDTGFPSTDPGRDPLALLLTPEEYAQFQVDDAWAQATLAETAALLHPLPGIPIRIVTATRVESDCWPGKDEAFCTEMARLNVEFQADWSSLSPSVEQVLVAAGHNLPWEATDIVLAEITIALEEIRAQ